MSRVVDVARATGGREIERGMLSDRASRRVLLGVSVLLFAASAALTVVRSISMSAQAVPMPGGWSLSMVWLRMPGQTWPDAAASFLGMWLVMMAAMMLPSLLLMLLRYRQAVGSHGGTRLGWLTAQVGVAYLLIWIAAGMIIFPVGAALASVEMQLPGLARIVPIAMAVVVMLAGALQFTGWKAHHLACCRRAPGTGQRLPADAAIAWRHGLRLGVHCAYCCVGPMAVLLAIGVMDLWVMAVVTTAISAERLLPDGQRVARATGAVAIGAGVFLLLRAAVHG